MSRAIELLEEENAKLREKLAKIKDLVKDLNDFHIYNGDLPNSFFTSYFYQKGDEDSPFFSETMLYGLFGKDPARSLLSRMNRLIKGCE